MKATWKDILDELEEYDYPSEQIAQFGGIPKDTAYHYVSSTFLNGFVNYTSGRDSSSPKPRAFVLNRYGIWKSSDDRDIQLPAEGQTVEQLYQLAANKVGEGHHTKLCGPNSDDTIVFMETEEDFWIYYYDRDCSDCELYRIGKYETDLVFVEGHGPGVEPAKLQGDKRDLTLDKLIELYRTHYSDQNVYQSWRSQNDFPEFVMVEIPKLSGWISG